MQQSSSEHTRYDTLITLLDNIQMLTEQMYLLLQAGYKEDAAKCMDSITTLNKLAQDILKKMGVREQ